MEIKHSVVINRPADEVFKFISQPENGSQWISGVHEIRRLTVGPAGVGTKALQVRHFLGKEMGSEYEITEFDQSKRRIVAKVTSGPVKGYEVEEEVSQAVSSAAAASKVGPGSSDQTVLTFVGRGEVGGTLSVFFKMASPLLVRLYERQLATDMETLKELLESRADTEPAAITT